MPRPELRVYGWREWVALPDLDTPAIKAKLDTGARTSSLHAIRLRAFMDGDRPMVRFEVHPVQRASKPSWEVVAEVIDERTVRSSGGHEELRPVIRSTLELAGERWPIELTLTPRDQMGFRMLLGRQALRGRGVVDPGASYQVSSSPGKRKKKPRAPRKVVG